MLVDVEEVISAAVEFVEFDAQHWNSDEGGFRYCEDVWVFYTKQRFTVSLEVYNKVTRHSVEATVDRAEIKLY